MSLQTINVGNFVNDGTGDDLRTAFVKINENFDELDLRGGQSNTISNVGTGVGIYKEKVGVNLRLKTLRSGSGITITADANEITIVNSRNLVNESTPTLSANLNINNNNLINGNQISATDFYGRFNGPSIGVHNGPVSGNVIGNLTGLVHGIDVRDLNNAINGFDFGSIDNVANSFLEYLFFTTAVDMGSITAPAPIGIEAGPIA